MRHLSFLLAAVLLVVGCDSFGSSSPEWEGVWLFRDDSYRVYYDLSKDSVRMLEKRTRRPRLCTAQVGRFVKKEGETLVWEVGNSLTETTIEVTGEGLIAPTPTRGERLFENVNFSGPKSTFFRCD